MEKKTIGSFLTALRKASGMTQRQLADKLNVSDKAVSRWERDECAPDLSLIPVLAEIYGVTSDEILRGQRANPDAPPREVDAAKAEKQRKHLLASAQTKFRTGSLVSTVIALIGLIATFACNFELGEANLGFLIGSVFFIIAIVCQIVFLIFGLSSVQDDDWNSTFLFDCTGSMVLWTEGILSGVIVLFTGLLPLAGASHDTVAFLTCLTEGLPCMLAGSIICFAACLILNLVLFRRTQSKKQRLRLCFTGILSLLLIALLVGHTLLNSYLLENPHRYAPHDEFATLQDFRAYIETPTAPDGCSLYSHQDYDFTTEYYSFTDPINGTGYAFLSSEITESLTEGRTPEDYSPGSDVFPEPDFFTAEYGYSFKHLNRNVVNYIVSDTDDFVPIYTLTVEQQAQANHIATQTSLRYALLYLIPILLGTAAYLPLRKKYA